MLDGPPQGQELIVHWMTKSLVIAAAVLSIALSALVIAYAVNTDRVVAESRNLSAQKLAAEASLSSQVAQASARQTELSNEIATLRQLNATLAGQVTTLQAERSTLINEKNVAESARQALESKIAELSETQKSLAALLQSYRTEVTGLRSSEMDARRAMLEMDDRINDLEGQREVLQQNVRALQEQLAEARRVTDGGTGSAAGVAAGVAGAARGTLAEAPFVYSGPVINGRVEEVSRDPATDRLLAKINVGTNDRVARNMVFYVTRGSEFVGNLVVRETDLGWSIGMVDTLGRTVDVRPGDTIQTRL